MSVVVVINLPVSCGGLPSVREHGQRKLHGPGRPDQLDTTYSVVYDIYGEAQVKDVVARVVVVDD